MTWQSGVEDALDKNYIKEIHLKFFNGRIGKAGYVFDTYKLGIKYLTGGSSQLEIERDGSSVVSMTSGTILEAKRGIKRMLAALKDMNPGALRNDGTICLTRLYVLVKKVVKPHLLTARSTS